MNELILRLHSAVQRCKALGAWGMAEAFQRWLDQEIAAEKARAA